MNINVNNINIFFKKCGSGAPLIMLHGNGESCEIFDAAARVLQNHFTLYLLDTRGHGQSQPVAEYHYADMADDVLEFVKVLHLEKPYIYGFSDGGITALLAAVKSPGIFGAIAVSGANINPGGLKPGFKLFMKILYAFKKDSKLKLMLLEPKISEKSLNSLKIPVLVTAGERDLISLQHTKLIHSSINGSTLKIIKGESHGSYIVNHEKIAEILLEFLSNL